MSIYRSSVQIYNPGSIYKNLDSMKFASSEVGSKIRNVLIASVLYNVTTLMLLERGLTELSPYA